MRVNISQEEYNRRYELIDKLADKATDEMDVEELRRYFYSNQFDYFDGMYFLTPIAELEAIVEEECK